MGIIQETFSKWLRPAIEKELKMQKEFIFEELSDPITGKEADSVSPSFNDATAMLMYKNHPDVFGCVRELSETVGANGFVFTDRKTGEKIEDSVAANIEDIFLTANRDTSLRQLIKRTVQHMSITGTYYWYFNKLGRENSRTLEVYGLPSKNMRVRMTPYGFVTGYYQKIANKEVSTFTPDEIVQFKHYDPENAAFGMSPMQPIYWELKLDITARALNFKYFLNDATPGTLYILDESLDSKELKKIAQRIKSEFTGYKNKSRAIVGAGIKDVKVISQNNKDMEFLDGRKMTTEKICAAYGVPKSKLSYTDSVNMSNGREMNETFYNDTILPIEEYITEMINLQVLPDIGFENVLFRFNPTSFKEVEKVENSTREDVKAGIRSIDEARKERGLSPLDESVYGDAGKTHFIMTPAGPLLLTDITTPLPADQASQDLNQALGKFLNEKKDENNTGTDSQENSGKKG